MNPGQPSGPPVKNLYYRSRSTGLCLLFFQNPHTSQSNSSTMANEPRKPEMLTPVYYSVMVLVFVLVACVELGDAVTAVDVYRLVQYDLSGVPYGSRFASLNHHAGSSFLSPDDGSGSFADLSRSVIMLPLRELNLTLIKGVLLLIAQTSSGFHCIEL